MVYIKEGNIKKLPDEKVEEAFNNCSGEIKHCPECGELTAFIGRVGYNDKSSCHNCGYTEDIKI